MSKELSGVVQKWCRTFGFIEYEAGPRLDYVFYSGQDIIPDAVGRSSTAKIEGNAVKFKIVKTTHRGRPTIKAVNVVPVLRCNVPDVASHREISTIEQIGSSSHALLRRQSGDRLYLSSKDVVEAFRDRWATLREGSLVYHGVAAPSERNKGWRAVAAEIFAADE